MNNRIVNILLFFSINIVFALILSLLTLYLFSMGLDGGYTILFFVLIVISILPIFNHLQKTIDSYLFPVSHDDMYVQIVDSILNIEYFDELLKETFDQVLRLMYAKVGRIIFYNQGSDKFEVYYQKGKRREELPEIEIDKDNILLQGIKGSNDILIKGWLDPFDKKDIKLINELERHGSEIVVPIYYKDTFLGLILIGEKRRFVEKEVRLLRIFASKIAIHIQNSFYFKKVLKRKELEKEYELTSKIQKQFLPETSLKNGNINVVVYHKTASSMTREFYDIFTVDTIPDEVRISAYRIHGDIKEISILLPGVKALLQSFARLGYSPFETLLILAKIGTEKDVLIGDFSILHSSLKQNGNFIYFNNGYPVPLIIKKTSKTLENLYEDAGNNEYNLQLEKEDLLIITSESFSEQITGDLKRYEKLINENFSASLQDLKKILIDELLKEESEKKIVSGEHTDKEDKLLILIKMEENID